MNKDLIYHGIRIGTHEFVPEKVIDRIQKDCIDEGMNYVRISLAGESFKIEGGIDRSWFRKWATFLRDNKVYFSFSTDERVLQEDNDVVREMKEIAGEYYLCNFAKSELGSHHASIGSGYGVAESKANNLLEAKENFQKVVRSEVNKAQFDGEIPLDYLPLSTVEATAILPYVVNQGFTFPCLETMCGNPEIMIPMLRANANMLKSPIWGTYIAHEWYAGVRNLDVIKLKRLNLVYDYAYMQGSSLFVLESGDECLYCHDMREGRPVSSFNPMTDTKCGYNDPGCVYYRNVLKEFAKFIKEDKRPAGGPKVKVAFVQGNLDAYTPWRAGSSLWNKFSDKNYGYSTPEFVWRIFDDVATKRTWCDVHNFGDVDLSGAPAYGTYDVIPATADYETLSKYEYLIFTGWNTMTDEIYENLKKYVHGGGKLFMTAAHLNTSVERNGEIKLINDGKVSDLFGCDLDAEKAFNVNDGFKFTESIVPGVMYPCDMEFDPLMSEGYISYADLTMKGAHASGKLSQNFTNRDLDAMPTFLTENKYGDGYAILMTSLDYPSAAGYWTYKTIVRELVTASHRAADVKVYGGDKLRFTVYEGNKIYLLNTDFDCKIEAIVDYGTEKKSFILEPLELKVIE